MRRLGGVEDLRRWRRELEAARPADQMTVRVCSTGCRALGALAVCEALEAEVAARGLGERVRVVRAGCHGLCAGAVTMVIDPGDIFYQNVTPDDAAEIVERTILGGRAIGRLCVRAEGRTFRRRRDVPFFRHQRRLVLRNCGMVDPTSLADAVAAGAYEAAAKALAEMTPEQVIEEVEASGLRGRGGAGFPTGRKWRFARAAEGEPKYVICNADEGDPGAFMDRALLEGDPHLVLEGMLIAARAAGASRGYIYLRSEYPLAEETLRRAIGQARQAGLLGQDILSSGMDFDIELVRGAGAYVCGEETSLIASIEGVRPMPRPRPPFPVSRGLHGRPTVTNNVETLANVPRILEMGAGAYGRIGTEASRGTKVLSLAGAVRWTGLVEVPMGTTLRAVICDIAGGVPDGRTFKAAHIGGPCGGCIPAEHLDLPVDYESLGAVGAMVGCGGLIVLDETTCMVDLALDLVRFAREESCGRCAPCRLGNPRLEEILGRIASGAGRAEDLAHVERIAGMIHEASFCGMAPDPVRSALRFFREEFEEHLAGRCPAGVCPMAPAAASPAGPDR